MTEGKIFQGISAWWQYIDMNMIGLAGDSARTW